MSNVYLTDTATWGHGTGYAADGSRTVTSTTVACRWEETPTRTLNAQAETVPARGRVWTAEELAVDDTLTHDGRAYVVVAVKRISDIAGTQWLFEAAIT